MPRPSNTEERRAQIASALVKVMAKHGYEGASIADIARTAQLTPGLVHYHFKNKQEILLEALRQLTARQLDRLDDRLRRAAPDPGAELAALIDFHLGLGADADAEALACWVLLGGEALRHRKVQAAYEKALAALALRVGEAIRRGVAAGAFRCDDVDAAASAVVAAIQGYFVLAASARSVIPRGTAAGCTKQMVDGLLHPVRPLARRKRA